MRFVSVHKVKTHLSEIIARVERGEEITIKRRRDPVAIKGRKRRPGAFTGQIVIKAGAFGPLVSESTTTVGEERLKALRFMLENCPENITTLSTACSSHRRISNPWQLLERTKSSINTVLTGYGRRSINGSCDHFPVK